VIKLLWNIHPILLLLSATILETSGDSAVRMGIYNHAGLIRNGLTPTGAALFPGYEDSTLNGRAPVFVSGLIITFSEPL